MEITVNSSSRRYGPFDCYSWWCLGTSETDGGIWKGDLSTGEGEIVISDGQVAGMDYDRRSGYLYVCGAFTGETSLGGISEYVSFSNGAFKRAPT